MVIFNSYFDITRGYVLSLAASNMARFVVPLFCFWFLTIPQKPTQSPGLYGQARATKRYIPGTSGMSINASMMKSFGKLVGRLGLEPHGTGWNWWVVGSSGPEKSENGSSLVLKMY